jgi:hypothetical protein
MQFLHTDKVKKKEKKSSFLFTFKHICHAIPGFRHTANDCSTRCSIFKEHTIIYYEIQK